MLPEQGMRSFEVLARASAFVTPWRGVRQSTSWPKYHVLGSAHVTHPFFFPNYYPEEKVPWLRFVKEDDTLNKLELRSVRPKTLVLQLAPLFLHLSLLLPLTR